MAEAAEREPVAVGTIGKPRGLQGECHVAGIGRTLASAQVPLRALVGRGGRDLRPLVVTSISGSNRGFVCRFEGVDDRTVAEGMRNQVIYLPQEQLPPLEDGEYYHFQLEGLRVVADDGVEVGVVLRVHNYPTVDALEVSRSEGSTVLLPIRDETVEEIDCEGGVVRVKSTSLEELL
jgi:16S rRNA processing protein RimM